MTYWQNQFQPITLAIKALGTNHHPSFLDAKLDYNTWSITEHISYLIQVNNAYCNDFDLVLKDEHRNPLLTKLPVLASLSEQLSLLFSKIRRHHLPRPQKLNTSETFSRFNDAMDEFEFSQLRLINYFNELTPLSSQHIVMRCPNFRLLYCRLRFLFFALIEFQKKHLAEMNKKLDAFY